MTTYRYGFNGKENDNEVKGEGNQQDYGLRIYDPRIGKFLSTDPLTQEYPWYTPYQFAGNTPIQAVDLDGAEPMYVVDSKGTDNDYTKKENRQGAKQAFLTVLTFTDIDDASVIATSITRKGAAVHIDGEPAPRMHKAAAAGGALLPIVGGAAVVKIVKGAKWLYNARLGVRVADAIAGGSGALRRSLTKTGVDLAGKEAHHVIPTQLLKENKVVQDAVNDGFDFNGVNNGIDLTKVADGGVHGNHPNYTEQIREQLTNFAATNTGYKPEDAKKFLEGLAGKLKQVIKKESIDGGKKINDLVLPK